MATRPSNGRVAFDVVDGVAAMRLANPEKKNAFSPGLAEDLLECIVAIESRDAVSAAILTAEGDTFCGGLDVGVLTGDDAAERRRLIGMLHDVREWLQHGSIPVVVAARGPAPGAGAILVTSADLRVVGSDLRLWWPEVAFGLEAYGRAVDLVAAVGAPKATELMLLGEHAKLDAAEARELGLVNRVEEPDSVDETARDMAETIAGYDREHGTIGGYLDVIQHARREIAGTGPDYARWRENELRIPD